MTFKNMIVAIRGSLSDFGSFDNVEDGEHEDDEETEQGKLSEDDEPSWVMGTINKTVQQLMQRFWKKPMKLDESIQPGLEDAANYFHERDEKYGTFKLWVPAVVQPQTDNNAVALAPRTFGDIMECLDIVPGISQMPERTS